ncbi:MAG: radical SAM protein [Candidatus Aminicenantes bacterium]|nr:radical SAM protein [Candidatus Aminicenantes bacterium]
MRKKEFSLIFVPTTSCNSSCAYCFQQKKKKESMTLDNYEQAVLRLAQYLRIKGTEKLNFYWQGGEVMLLGVGYIKSAIKIQEKIGRETGIEFKNRLQTNLLLYDSSWTSVIKESFGGVLGSSLDFPNLYRRAPEISIEKYPLMWLEKYKLASGDGIRVNAISIPNRRSFKIGPKAFLDYYRKDLGIQSIQLNFAFPFSAGGRLRKEMENSLEELNNFIKDLFLYYLEVRKDHHFEISPFENILSSFRDRGIKQRPCIFSRVCAENFMALGPDGSCALCDCWLEGGEKFRFGNLIKEEPEVLFENTFRKRIFKRLDKILNEDCYDCPFLQMCFGGCPVRTYSFYGDIFHKDFYCPVYLTMFRIAAERA